MPSREHLLPGFEPTTLLCLFALNEGLFGTADVRYVHRRPRIARRLKARLATFPAFSRHWLEFCYVLRFSSLVG